jgi:hypothetical protein
MGLLCTMIIIVVISPIHCSIYMLSTYTLLVVSLNTYDELIKACHSLLHHIIYKTRRSLLLQSLIILKVYKKSFFKWDIMKKKREI